MTNGLCRCYSKQVPWQWPDLRLREPDLRPGLCLCGLRLEARREGRCVQGRRRARSRNVRLLPPPLSRSRTRSPVSNTRRTHGPLIHDKALEKVQRHIDDALARGAQLLVGGTRLPGKGSFFQPTLLADVPADALVNSEETFGPLGALTRFSTEEEVLRLANDAKVGLAGYFYSRDVGRVWRVAEALEVGMVGTNTGLISQAVIPFGGVKESGLGGCFHASPWRFPGR